MISADSNEYLDLHPAEAFSATDPSEKEALHRAAATNKSAGSPDLRRNHRHRS